MAEVVPSLTLIRDALVNLNRWMRPEARATSILFWPARNRVYWQPKGVVLIIAPWNYPLQLTVGALAAALAAGNRVIVKPSETTPATAGALKRTLEGALGSDRVTVATGGPMWPRRCARCRSITFSSPAPRRSASASCRRPHRTSPP